MKTKRVLVIGLGRMGTALVEELWDTNVEIVVVDKNDAAVDVVKDKAAAAFVADGSDPRVLESIGAGDMDVAVVTYSEDFEANVLAVASLAQMKVPVIIARGANERQRAVLAAVGATRVVLVEHEMGRRLAPEVLSPVSADFAEYASAFRVVPWSARGHVVGKTLVELDLRRRYEVNVLGVWREPSPGEKKARLDVVGPQYRIGAGDTLLLLGVGDALEKFLDDA
jgi:trk system potassium uptake protein TrkA